jgi:hypothetical protein
MRAPLLLAATLVLAACSNNDQTDNTQNIDENLTAENIVSNDVTAIDAVTADAANMAADVQINESDLNLDNAGDNSAAPARPKRTHAAPKTYEPLANSASSNATGNSAQ